MVEIKSRYNKDALQYENVAKRVRGENKKKPRAKPAKEAAAAAKNAVRVKIPVRRKDARDYENIGKAFRSKPSSWINRFEE